MKKRLNNILIISSLLLFLLNFQLFAQNDTVLEPGDKGDEVREIQNNLIDQNLLYGEPDGVYGEYTREAVKTFQKEMDLEADGIVDQETQNLLQEDQKTEEKSDKDSNNNRPLLEMGDVNEEVEDLKSKLNNLGFYTGEINNNFGLQTELAVKHLQKFYNLEDDGVVGPKTWEVIENNNNNNNNSSAEYKVQAGDTLWELSRKWDTSVDSIKKINNMNNSNHLTEGKEIKIPDKVDTQTVNPKSIEDLSWDTVDKLFPVDNTAILTDVETGLSFRVKRLYGTKHADVEPLTAKDTETLREIYGGQWSWNRRAVIVHIDNRQIAGSINGQPHADQSIENNNFNGHICLHFRGSRLHKNGHPDKDHQNEIEQSASNEWPLNLN